MAPVCWWVKLQSISPEQTPKPRPCWMPTVHSSMVTQSVAEHVVLGARFAFGAMFHSMIPPLASRTPIRRSFNLFRSLVYSPVYLGLHVLCDLSDGLLTTQRAYEKQQATVPSTRERHSAARFGAHPHSAQFFTAAPWLPLGLLKPSHPVLKSSTRMT